MDRDVPNGTLRIEITGTPTCKRHLDDLQGAIRYTVFEFWNADPEAWVGQFLTQPYSQGGTLVTFQLYAPEVWRKQWHEEFYEGVDPANEPDFDKPWGFRTEEVGDLRFTGWVFTDWYTDSMTGVFESPIFCNDEEGWYTAWEM